MDVQGHGVLVTGGASGLGLATAMRMADQGAFVVVVDLPGGQGERATEALADRGCFVAADVTSETDMRRAIAEVAARGHELRVVVSCAGVATPGRVLGRGGPLALETFRRVVEINLVGTFNVLRLAAETMAELDEVDGERGVVVLTASIAAFEGQVGQAAYASSKAGVHGLTLSAARDLADRRIRVCTLAPGTFETPMLAGLSQEARTSLGEQVPHPRRLGRPEEYAALVSHVVENPMLNGETIRIDGALRMGPR